MVRRSGKISFFGKRSPTSITSGSRSASSTPAGQVRTVTSSYKPLERSRASIFAEAGKRTPCSCVLTVVGERGSTDTARDVRGFAVKFYTDEGNWDLVGNNIPVFSSRTR